ncbi:sigma-54-dependent Fis family transcriptional regulator [Salinimicrobium tongyeongense]|uniref:Sigma-54-dependent Fis family transcriptional regulator n=1 Tax=Salinimicrobium tongyeongense TaxID=2809707 RepID=A0ABY6NQ68_9FLAO|nr:sigma-54 dependent transcriptional regulator [Salinimicrobium tongyeongense]UZH54953.1 sigma-54-dependent Fis family transcriptional regulator [Salinimicrobium tongyeongense]
MALHKENVLIVDDDYDMLELIHRNLSALHFHTYRAISVKEAIEILKSSRIDLLITDLQMPGVNGIELIKYADEHYPKMPKLVITGFPSVDGAISAIRSGALDYLVKPFTQAELKSAIEKSLQHRRSETTHIKKEKPVTSAYAGMIGSSESFEEMIDVIERVKDNRATILIQGESGTGKELVARAIHYKGAYAANPFIAVNCGAIPENLLESELFGYVKGAFTGAGGSRQGFFQAAAGGTIFLDEIGTAPANVQTSLLRVLQEKEVRRIGAQKSEKIELRIIAATNSDLYQMVEKGSFRQDLYYRLNVVNITTPPLRERKEDILPLVQNFIKKYGVEYKKPFAGISDKAIELLTRYSWPGNIRELENVVQRAIILCDKNIDVEEIPKHIKLAEPAAVADVQKSLKEAEREHIQKVLASVDGNKTRAAEILQIDRKTLRQKLK